MQEGQVIKAELLWQPHAQLEANLFIGSVRMSLMQNVQVEGRIHSESLLTIIGALVGMAAQVAVINEYVIPKKEIPENGFVQVQTKDGETYYFGDLLNAYLVPQRSQLALWSLSASIAVSNGVDPRELPDVNAMFKRAAQTLGSPEFDQLDVPEPNQPMISPKQSVERFWLMVRDLVNAANSHLGMEPQPFVPQSPDQQLKPQDIPLALAVVAQGFLNDTKSVLDPRIGLSIVMQSAIIASKYDANKLQFQESVMAQPGHG